MIFPREFLSVVFLHGCFYCSKSFAPLYVEVVEVFVLHTMERTSFFVCRGSTGYVWQFFNRGLAPDSALQSGKTSPCQKVFHFC